MTQHSTNPWHFQTLKLIVGHTKCYQMAISLLQLGHKILQLTHKILQLACPKYHLTNLHILEQIINMENIIITNWSCYELGKTANNSVLFSPYNWSNVAAIILHFLWMLYTIILLSFLPIKAQPISLGINGSIMSKFIMQKFLECKLRTYLCFLFLWSSSFTWLTFTLL